MVKIGQATCDEHGKTTGGKAGDQTKKEVNISNWSYSSTNTAYNHWTLVFRAKDKTIAEQLAKSMITACQNENIGYDLGANDRGTLYEEAKKVNWDLSKIKNPCETSCVDLVSVCLNSVGIKTPKYWATVNVYKDLMATNKFNCFTSTDYTASCNKLEPGDILCSPNAPHTAMVIEVDKMKTIDEIAKEVIAGKWGSGDERKKKLKAAGYDYDKVQKKVNELIEASKTWKDKANDWAVKIVKSGKYKYKKWTSSNVNTHKCPICNPGTGNGWNCIGFAMACWRHGGGLKNKCSCGTIDNGTWDKLLTMKSDAEADKLASQLMKVPVKVIRNGGKSVASQCKKGDIGALYHGKTYYHTFYCMGNMKYADSTSGRTPNIKANNSMSQNWKNDFKLIIRYVGDSTKKKTVEEVAKEVINGKWGSGDERKKKLKAAGYDYDKVQKKVNELLNSKPTPTPAPAPVKKAYDKTFPSLTLKKTNAEVISDAIVWGNWIAGDNSFHYGKGKHAHHNGCYFCGTQPKVKKEAGIKDYQKTYCCNPFIGAALAHGGCIPKALEMCKKGKSWDFNKGSGYDASSLFKNLGKPAKSKLKKGDVLCSNTHVMMYIGNGKIMEAAYEDDNVRNSKKWNGSIRITTLTTARYAGVKRVHRYTGSVNTKRAIEFGEVSKRVKHLQAYLNWYFGKKVCGTPDGLFGSNTLKYVKKFQEKRKLKVDGVVGPATIEEMKKVKK